MAQGGLASTRSRTGGAGTTSAAVGRKDASARQDTESFRFQISKALPEHLLIDWFAQAAPGERIEYCEGYVPLRDDAAWKLAGAWQREGLVNLVTEREGTRTRWIAEKRGSAASSSAAVGRKERDPKAEPLLQTQMRALLDLLRAAAAAGARCPSKTEMAEQVTGATSLRARNRVTYLRRRLEAEGKIAVIAGSHKQAPVVTILARGKGCGKSTAADVAGGE
jgi:hypothetical protein